MSKEKSEAEIVTIPMVKLMLAHSEIGVHRGRKHGFRDVFGFQTLHNVPFLKLAQKVKAAYLGENEPRHKGWPAQREALKWFVDKGPEAMYQLKGSIRVFTGLHGTYFINGGNHRSLALYIMGADTVRAVVSHGKRRIHSTYLANCATVGSVSRSMIRPRR